MLGCNGVESKCVCVWDWFIGSAEGMTVQGIQGIAAQVAIVTPSCPLPGHQDNAEQNRLLSSD